MNCTINHVFPFVLFVVNKYSLFCPLLGPAMAFCIRLCLFVICLLLENYVAETISSVMLMGRSWNLARAAVFSRLSRERAPVNAEVQVIWCFLFSWSPTAPSREGNYIICTEFVLPGEGTVCSCKVRRGGSLLNGLVWSSWILGSICNWLPRKGQLHLKKWLCAILSILTLFPSRFYKMDKVCFST